jgi:hypothetical protein
MSPVTVSSGWRRRAAFQVVKPRSSHDTHVFGRKTTGGLTAEIRYCLDATGALTKVKKVLNASLWGNAAACSERYTEQFSVPITPQAGSILRGIYLISLSGEGHLDELGSLTKQELFRGAVPGVGP